MSGILQGLHGSIDAPSVIHQLLASTQSGDMHTAVYDFAANTMYLPPFLIVYFIVCIVPFHQLDTGT